VTHAFFAAGRPLVFAHRGGAGLAPENTFAAFDRGLAVGADGLECDVRLSRDGQVVVHHDAHLDRTTNLAGPLDAFTAAQLQQADAGHHFRSGQDFPFRGRGVGVPTLAAMLARYPRCRIIIELKLNTAALAAAVLAVIRAAGARDRVCLGSFGRRVLRAVRGLDPGVATSAAREEVRWALYRSWIGWPARSVPYDGFQVPELAGRTRVVSPTFVAAAHRLGLGVQVWTVDSPDTARRLVSWGVDAIISDRPDLVVPAVGDPASRPVP
jgi:glycerophosphoryl diester phosphodiesterase